MTRHRQKTLIGGAEPESFGKQIRKDTTLQNRKLLPWLFVGPFLWVHVVHSQGTADTARTSAAMTGNGDAEAKTNDTSFFGLTSCGASSVPPNLRPSQLVLPRAHLLGDRYGLRPNLEDRGFTPTLTFVSDVAGNVTGGKNQGEMFPNRMRAEALAVSGATNCLANFTVTVSFLPLLTAVGFAGAYGLYGLAAIVSLLFVWTAVRETKGKTLEEM